MAVESRRINNQLRALVDALTWTQRISLLFFATAVIVGVVSLMYFMNQDEYQVLYSELGSEEANIVIERLKVENVLYQLGDSGRSISVPSERLNELRILLASEGLPQGGKIGFEIFDQTNLGMTEFVERVSYRRALEGELGRTILSLKEIGQVRVHLVLPKESLFESQTEPAKASVVVKLKSGKQLNATVVSGISHLVGSAVEGLTPDNVTVVDSNGRLLSGAQGSTEEALTASQAQQKARTEKDLTTKIVNILEPIVGGGKVKADTSVVMNFGRSEQTEERYEPQGVIRSQQKNEERSDPLAAAPTAGVPGTQSNDANPAPIFIPLTRGGSSSSRQIETTNYEVSKVTRHTLEPVGQIQKLSVAVIVDDAIRTETAADGTSTRTATPRTPEDLQKIKDLVSAAVGIDVMRGDLVTIENIAFDVPEAFEEIATGFTQEWRTLLRPALRYGAFLVLFLLVYMFLVRPITKRLVATESDALTGGLGEGAPGLSAPKTVKEYEAALNQGSGSALVQRAEGLKNDILKQRIGEFVQKEPEKGAQLLRAWLTEDGKG